MPWTQPARGRQARPLAAHRSGHCAQSSWRGLGFGGRDLEPAHGTPLGVQHDEVQSADHGDFVYFVGDLFKRLELSANDLDEVLKEVRMNLEEDINLTPTEKS